jgi:hypothetical protein
MKPASLAVILTSALLAFVPASFSAKPPTVSAPVLFNTPAADAILAELQIFPPDNPWHQPVSDWPLHPDSAKIVASVGTDKPLRYNPDMAFVIVPKDQPRVAVKITDYTDESDPGPYPVPTNTPIEGWPAFFKRSDDYRTATLDSVQRDLQKLGGDRHAIVVDPSAGLLCEFYALLKTDTGWEAKQASIFDLKSNRSRPDGWTSSDAAGLPLFPALVRWDELKRGRIDHALIP